MERGRRGRGASARTAMICAAAAVGMTGAAFAAVPLYRAFCQATGFGGAIPKASSAPGQVADRELTIYFDTNVRGVPWTFEPEQRSQKVKVGATNVGTIRQTFVPDRAAQKGDEKGLFAFGGSCVITLFQRGRMRFDADLVEWSAQGVEIYAKMGDRMGATPRA